MAPDIAGYVLLNEMCVHSTSIIDSLRIQVDKEVDPTIVNEKRNL